MFAKLKYGIGQEVTVPMPVDTVNRLSGQSVQEAIQELLAGVGEDPDGTAPVLREAVQDPRSVIEVKSRSGYEPLEGRAPFKGVLRGRQSLELLISRPHAGG